MRCGVQRFCSLDPRSVVQYPPIIKCTPLQPPARGIVPRVTEKFEGHGTCTSVGYEPMARNPIRGTIDRGGILTGQPRRDFAVSLLLTKDHNRGRAVLPALSCRASAARASTHVVRHPVGGNRMPPRQSSSGGTQAGLRPNVNAGNRSTTPRRWLAADVSRAPLPCAAADQPPRPQGS